MSHRKYNPPSSMSSTSDHDKDDMNSGSSSSSPKRQKKSDESMQLDLVPSISTTAASRLQKTWRLNFSTASTRKLALKFLQPGVGVSIECAKSMRYDFFLFDLIISISWTFYSLFFFHRTDFADIFHCLSQFRGSCHPSARKTHDCRYQGDSTAHPHAQHLPPWLSCESVGP